MSKEIDFHTYLNPYVEFAKIAFTKMAPKGSICWEVGNYVKDGEVYPLDIYFYDIFKGFDHGVGHPLLLLCDAKAPNCRKNKTFKDIGHYSEWPKVADAVIKACSKMPVLNSETASFGISSMGYTPQRDFPAGMKPSCGLPRPMTTRLISIVSASLRNIQGSCTIKAKSAAYPLVIHFEKTARHYRIVTLTIRGLFSKHPEMTNAVSFPLRSAPKSIA
jgi:hypothetical protein